MKAVQISEYGGPDVLKYRDVADLTPGRGEALVGIQAVGVNFTDTYSRAGINPGPTALTTPAARLVKLPQGLDAKAGAAAMLQGMTAHYLCHATYPVRKGDRVLIHAGAGGMGLLLTQMVKRLGGYIFATVSTEAKAELSRQAGADQVIIYTQRDFAEEVKRGTNGEGVQVVYDAVGKTTFDQSVRCLARRGYMVLYGQASGPVPPMDPRILGNGSLFLSRPGLGDYTATRKELEQRSGDVLKWVKSGELKLRVEHVFPLSEAAEAHRQLESRATTGKVLLVP